MNVTMQNQTVEEEKIVERKLSSGALKFMAAIAFCFGLWASYITYQFFVHGTAAMEADPAVRNLSIAAATMFVVTEMAAFWLFRTLPQDKLHSYRWTLGAFTAAMLAFECLTIIMTQQGITKAADYTAQATDSRAKQLAESIAAQRAGAAALRDAGVQSSKSIFAPSREQGAASVRQSLEIEQQLAAKADELARVQADRKPTTTELLGETGAMLYATARGLLVSIAGLVFFGASGSLLRAARHSPESAPNKRMRQMTAAAAVAAPVGLATSMAPAPADAAQQHTHAAPEQTHADGAMPIPARDAAQQPAAPPVIPQQSPWGAMPIPAQPVMPKPAWEHPAWDKTGATPAQADSTKPARKPARRSTATPDGSRRDTGTSDADGSRYARVCEGVKSGRIRPTHDDIKRAEGGSTPVVKRYLEKMHADGLIKPNPKRPGAYVRQ